MINTFLSIYKFIRHKVYHLFSGKLKKFHESNKLKKYFGNLAQKVKGIKRDN